MSVMTQEELIERFGVADADGVIVVDREALLRDIINRGVYLLKETDTLKEDLKEVVAESKEYGFVKTEVSELIKHAYKNTIQDQIDDLRAVQAKLDKLFGETNDE